MNTNTINKDNVGSATLLAAMFLSITVALFSGAASAKAVNITAPKAQAQAAAAKTTTDTIVITATRLK